MGTGGADDLYVRARMWSRSSSPPTKAASGGASAEDCESPNSSFTRRPSSDKRVRFARLAEFTAKLPTSGPANAAAASHGPNSRGRRLSWSDVSFETLRGGEEVRTRSPPPPSSASSVSSRRSSASSEAGRSNSSGRSGTASETEEEHDNSERVEMGPRRLLCVPSGRAAAASLADVRRAVDATFGVPRHLQWLDVPRSGGAVLLGAAAGAEGGGDGDGGGEDGAGDAATTLASLGMRAGDDLLIERAAAADAPSLLVERLEARRSRLNIFFNALGSTDFCHEIAADARETLGELKWRVCDRLGVDAEGVRLRRGVRGAHLRAEATTVVGERGAGLIDGCAVYVERGAPLGAELLVRAYWAEEEEQPFERAAPRAAARRRRRSRRARRGRR